jgi:hypothetical protein
MNLYRNKKSGKMYMVLMPEVINATNAQDGQKMVFYCGEKKDGSAKGFFVREVKEFNEKFEFVESGT